MKKFLSLIIVLVLVFTLCSCETYTNSYKAFGLVKKQTLHSCEASFNSLEGQMVFKIKKSTKGAEGIIHYSIQVDKGEINLYYDIYGFKEELANVKAGETVNDCGGYIEGGKLVYIIILAKENSKGKISVELD